MFSYSVQYLHSSHSIYSIYTVYVQVPVDLLFRLTIPVVDTERPHNNWCQYLAILHTLLGNLIILLSVNNQYNHLHNPKAQYSRCSRPPWPWTAWAAPRSRLDITNYYSSIHITL